MQNKSLLALIVLAVLVVVAGLLIDISDNSNEVMGDENAPINPSQPSGEHTPINNKTLIDQNKHSKQSMPSNDHHTAQQQAVLSEIANREFSNDPFIELISLNLKVGFCNNELDITILLKELSDNYLQHQELAESLKKKCEEHQLTYPTILSMSEKQLKDLFQPTSQLGQLLKSQFNGQLSVDERNENNRLTLFYALKEQNSSLLISSAFMQRFGGGDMQPLKTVLHSNDKAYLSQMSQLALALLSCEYQNGQTCETTSTMMVMICSQDPNSCGLDFPTWFENNTLPGMKLDVEKLINYYQQFNH